MRSRSLSASGAVLIPALAALAALPAAAQEAAPGAASPVFACRTIAEDAARLACYDREVAALQAAEANNEVVIVDQEVVTRARRDLFGFSLPKIDLFRKRDKGKDAEPEEIRRIEDSLAAFRIDATGRALITLANGARWLQTDNAPVLGEPKAGEKVVIETAALGSFKASIGGRRAIRVKRLN
ncbi:hypothetical protein [Erythrobacter donghaensis]|jgi:hypothetical protein|uniref:hypothetical protein n=1 Tax=Erythrobacter donghaensis TaxID=267135 RepID=UPI00094066F0|nr:hypothetical protein [Erythrobacter donghaensis]